MNTSRAGFLFTIKLFQQFAKTTSMKLQTIKSSEDKEYLGFFLTSSVYYWFIKRSHTVRQKWRQGVMEMVVVKYC